ncbi:glycosyltransferase family 87 protein [Marinoscillum furvescens]|uniref:Uncharacterized protein DUF2029 n=1 Tax=Marinoscillum furvescens DSM 4134 TaxID=1122208 RepID=A0A3D9L316_MARFU|nr:glycosyltransferase family 87 protein [Marinoscillum furvescens]RED99423.1 uncharacterized protein DUF2029 [Marinoscillum furvescens DSM 4134]
MTSTADHKSSTNAAAFILLAGVSAIGTSIERDQSLMLGMAFCSAFFAYVWLCKFPPTQNQSLWLGLIARGLLFFHLPTLSDDIYRFLWDGYLLHTDLDPYLYTPELLISHEALPASIPTELYSRLNSPGYFTIYPPSNQLIFWLATWSDDWLTATNVIRGCLVGAELVSLFLLRKLLANFQLSRHLANWYWLNPLIILEFTGNIHFEGIVIAFLLLTIYFWQVHRPVLTGLALGLAAGTKLLPLIYLPALLFRTSRKSGILACGIAILVFIIVMAPMVSGAFIQSMSTSLELYVRKFEFNASLYFVLRSIGYWIKGYNIINTLGPALAALTAISIFTWAWQARTRPVPLVLLGSLTIYLLLATTVHPWYVLPLIPLGILSGLYYPIVWSAMVFVTYFGYSTSGFELSAIWVVVEYTVVFLYAGFELYSKYHAQDA